MAWPLQSFGKHIEVYFRYYAVAMAISLLSIGGGLFVGYCCGIATGGIVAILVTWVIVVSLTKGESAKAIAQSHHEENSRHLAAKNRQVPSTANMMTCRCSECKHWRRLIHMGGAVFNSGHSDQTNREATIARIIKLDGLESHPLNGQHVT